MDTSKQSDPEKMLSEQEKLNLANTFLQSLKEKDWDLLRSILTTDSTWTLPGTSIISGKAIGIDSVIERAQLIVGFGVSLELNHILYGLNDFALSIHNQATRGNLQLDEFLATVCLLQKDKIANINTYLTDVTMVNAFFTKEGLAE